ncbi:MAG: response regulator [Sideroxydans sp.]|nr:response regulator [Sideroxydans sp.]
MNTLLLVEDDPALSSYLASALQQEGFKVTSADSRASALAVTPQPTRAIVDLGLPPAASRTTEGLMLIDALLARAPKTKIIVLTGQDEESSAFEAVRRGAFDFITKPAALSKIKASLDRAELFLNQERKLEAVGETRIQITARLSDGPKEASSAVEEQLVRGALANSNGNVAEAARQLGLAREHLYYYIKKYGIQIGRAQETQ